jgi:hypothetical protein
LCYTTRYPGVTTSFEDRLAVSEEAADLKKYLKCFRTFAQSLWEEQKRDLLQCKKIEIIQPSQQRPLRINGIVLNIISDYEYRQTG